MRRFGTVLVVVLALSALSPPVRCSAAPKSPAVKVEVLGVKGALRKNVLTSLTLADKSRRKNATEEELRVMHARAEDEIRRALQPYGYYRPIVRSESVTE